MGFPTTWSGQVVYFLLVQTVYNRIDFWCTTLKIYTLRIAAVWLSDQLMATHAGELMRTLASAGTYYRIQRT